MKKFLCLALCILMTLSLLSGCTRGMDLFIQDKPDRSDNASSEPTEPPKPALNPDLVKCLGDLLDEDAEAAIHQLMKELQDAYNSYDQSGDFITFGETVDRTLTEYEGFLNELRDELSNIVKTETDKDRKALATLLSLQATNSHLTSSSWDLYVFNIQMGERPSQSADKVKQDILETINSLSQLFYTLNICPVAYYNEPIQTEPSIQNSNDKKLICSNCGKDCTSRGLEANGLCADCNKPTAIAPYEVTPYLLDILESTHPIYSEPSYSSNYVGTVQYAGYYTIVAEAWDNNGNVWGKLKSGSGWIDISMYDRPSQKPQSNVGSGTTGKGLFHALDYSKVWAADYYFGGYLYHIYLVFEKDGTCYFALADMQLWDAGKGSYSVNDNSVTINITAGGRKLSGTYRFESDTNALIVTSQEGLVGQQGDVFTLYEDTANDVDKIIKWGNDYANSSPSLD